MKKILSVGLLLLGLTACAGDPLPTLMPTLDATVLFETAVSQVDADLTVTQTHYPTETLPSVNTETPIPTIDRTRIPLQSPTSETICDHAAAGQPIDVTIPDGTVMAPGENFTKTWRLKNEGTCTWTRAYTLTFFSSNALSAIQVVNLPQEVAPGQLIDLSVDMVAPMSEGAYQSNWMLTNAEGEVFGLGPNADAPFWAQIEVVQLVTDTPQPSPTVTNTPVVYRTGEISVGNGDQVDLDAGILNPDDMTKADFAYESGGEPMFNLMPMNDALYYVFGEEQPAFHACLSDDLAGDDIAFDELAVGTYLCYRTSDMLPGWLLFEGFDGQKLLIRFLTWSVP